MTQLQTDAALPGPAAQMLFNQVYADLRKRARTLLASHQTSSLNTTALVHEAYLKFGRSPQSPSSALHFFNAASVAMRQVIIDHARYLSAHKRSADAVVTLDGHLNEEGAMNVSETMRLSDALEALRAGDARLAQIVDLHFFAGLGFAEIAKLLDVSLSTVERDWRTARALLYRDMAE
ncbi:MAG: sigma-70 family RNA polymerase sigma factor [Rudaea sp.]|uniref:ECF-type sigma factor n=1 Tax=Rudaea sp. 3F27F6 TaxID=2502208 RepID=UPI001485566F|nr:ECF-type sigma factor [Rudaea sp. 3F27F6]MBR0347722.1 sigma-70 family RNA polymerase sigma factor [Rudaea sp.]